MQNHIANLIKQNTLKKFLTNKIGTIQYMYIVCNIQLTILAGLHLKTWQLVDIDSFSQDKQSANIPH